MKGIHMRRTTWRAILVCGLLLPAGLQGRVQGADTTPAFVPPLLPAVSAPVQPSADAPLLSNDPLPPGPSPMPTSGVLPPISTLPGAAAPVSAASPTQPATLGFQPPPTALMPPPPVSPMMAQPAPETTPAVNPIPVPPAIPTDLTPPVAPAPIMPPVPGAMTAPAGGVSEIPAPAMTPDQAEVVRKLARSLAAIRYLSEEPRSNQALGRVIDSGKVCSRLLGLAAFPAMPRFEARPDETVVRDRSYGSWEYRKYGAFQTRLDGRIRPVAGHVHCDLTFEARGHSRVVVRGSMTSSGPMDGTLAVEGYDAWGRPWKMTVQMSELLLRDDGLPSGGTLSLNGSDPANRSSMVYLKFPLADPVNPVVQKEKRRPTHRGRRY